MGTNLKMLRLHHGLTQQELADLINVTKAAISAIESGRTNKGLALEKVSDVLDVPVEVLLSDSAKLVTPYIDGNRIVTKTKVKVGPKAKAEPKTKAKESPTTPLVKPFEKPADHEPQPMYATRLNIEANEAKDEDNKVFKIPEKKRDIHELNIVQLLACTSSAANKYLANGWILLNSFARYSDGEFMVLLGSTKFVSNEEFTNLKREARTTPPLTYRPQRFGR